MCIMGALSDNDTSFFCVGILEAVGNPETFLTDSEVITSMAVQEQNEQEFLN